MKKGLLICMLTLALSACLVQQPDPVRDGGQARATQTEAHTQTPSQWKRILRQWRHLARRRIQSPSR